MIISFLPVFAQNQLGLRLSNFSGINGAQLNPASFLASGQKWDLSVVSGGFFAYNEYAYLENTHLLELIKYKEESIPRSGEEAVVDPNKIYYNYFDATKNISIDLNLFVGLPSFIIRFNKMSVGFYSNIRTAVGTHKLDKDLDFYSLDEWKDGELRHIDKGKISGAIWGELGFNMGFITYDDMFQSAYFGANLKYLLPSQSFYVRSNNNSGVVREHDSLFVNGGPYEVGFTTLKSVVNGGGLGVDLGFEYIKKDIERNGKKYKWKFGASLLDLGYMTFKRDAQKHHIEARDLYEIDNSSYKSVKNVDDAVANNSKQMLGKEGLSYESGKYTLMTPTALSLQYDVALPSNFFLNATLNRRIEMAPVLPRENIIALSARYENEWFEIGLPAVLYNDRHLRMGTWIRLGPFTVGSDHIASIFFDRKQFAGTDFYFAFRIMSDNWIFGKSHHKKIKNNIENCFVF